MEHVVIIGGGGTAAALAYDLTLRGFRVSLFEKGELLSGTTGRHHGLLHSGARYAVHDPEAARECVEENMILRRLAPDALEQNDGLFVALDDEDMEYRDIFVASCRAAGIPVREITSAEALAVEPALSHDLKGAFQVPDATVDAWRLPMHFFASARILGAEINNFCEVTGIHTRDGTVSGVSVFDYVRRREYRVSCDLVVNAAGSWAGRVAAVPVRPGPGVMVAIPARLTNMVINRLHAAGEGDIIVPQRRLSILGTSLWLAEEPEPIALPEDHVQKMFDHCARMVPAVNEFPVHSAWCAARPLIAGGNTDTPQEISRTFACYDHRVRDNIEGLVSVIGGKATTLRAMAESAADLICRKTGHHIPCRTKMRALADYRLFYKGTNR
jgi:glycerol-3-phosphate dehydrogenase